jgi:hypothetical protein
MQIAMEPATALLRICKRKAEPLVASAYSNRETSTMELMVARI